MIQLPTLHLPKGSAGKKGEDAACAFLRRAGFRIRARNFRTPIGEIDVVCRKADTVVFAEVKTLKKGAAAYSPELHFTQEKLRRMQRVALLYCKSNRLSPEADMRFDLIAVELGEGNAELVVRHYENLGT